jgi:hypothetical protein
VWVSSQNVPLIRFADQVHSIGSTGLDLVGVVESPPELLHRLRSFESIVSWYGSNRTEFREAVAGLPFEFYAALPSEGTGVNASDFYLSQVGFPPGTSPRIDCPREDGGFIAIHPFSGSLKKNWPTAHFCELARRLESFAPVEWCIELDGEPRIPDLYNLACWLAKARLYIGNDSGITHLAAAVGTPVVAWFGPTDPAVWAPRGDHVITVFNGDLDAMEKACVRLITHVEMDAGVGRGGRHASGIDRNHHRR